MTILANIKTIQYQNTFDNTIISKHINFIHTLIEYELFTLIDFAPGPLDCQIEKVLLFKVLL